MTTGIDSFYGSVIDDLLRTGVLGKEMRILVVCGGGLDHQVLSQTGFREAVISNLDSRMDGKEFAPLAWSFQDAEHLSFADDSFDFCMAHSGLHHCHSPHRALLEMYRVAKKGLLLVEPYDNLLTRLGVWLSFGQDYEHSAVFHNDCSYGGVQNSPMPNYVYRWTEREIIKTINSVAPEGKHRFRFIHKTRLPWPQLRGRKNRLFLIAAVLAWPILKTISIVCPKQSNNFAAVVLKPEYPRDLHPWLLWEGGKIQLNGPWLRTRYREK